MMKFPLKFFPLLILSTISQAAYEDHFPVYYEYCTGTQWKLQGGEPGGSPGHAFTYIHGLCKDYRSDYPQVIPCSQVSAKLKGKYPHSGVGISLDKNFSNVMWVAVPGRDLMLFGDKDPKSISKADVKKHVEKINDLKIFDKVIHKSVDKKNIPRNSPAYLSEVAEDTLGTDHAVSWARELHCVKIPATEDSLTKAAQFLNDSNNQYKEGPSYEWSKLSNNCVHLSLNTSSAIGLNDSILVDQKFIKKLSNMALPANGFLMLADEAVLASPPSKRELKKSLEKSGLNPTQVGSLINSYDAFPSGEVFDNEELKVLTAPRVKKPFKLLATPEKYEKKYMTPQNSDLKANAQMWAKRYEKLLAELKAKERGSEVERYLRKQLELSYKILKTEK